MNSLIERLTKENKELQERVSKQHDQILVLRTKVYTTRDRIKVLENRCITYRRMLKEAGHTGNDNDCIFNKSTKACHALSYKSCNKCSFYKSNKEWEREEFDEESQTGGFIHPKNNSN